jgi:WD40 repeat protein
MVVRMLLLLTLAAQAPAQPRLDALGDPLPPSAIARLGTLRFKHTPPLIRDIRFDNLPGTEQSTVLQAAFSPDGKRIATVASPTGDIRVWDVATGREVPGPWHSPDSAFQADAIAFSTDGSILAGIGIGALDANQFGSLLTLWNLDQPKVVRVFGKGEVGDTAQTLTFCDGGKTLLAIDTGGKCTSWDSATGKRLRVTKIPAYRQSQDNPNNGTQIEYDSDATAGPTAFAVRTMRFEGDDRTGIDLTDVELTIYNHAGANGIHHVIHRARTPRDQRISSVAFSSNGRRMAFSGPTGEVEIRDAASGKLLYAIDAAKVSSPAAVPEVVLSTDGKHLAIATDAAKVLLWDQDRPEDLRTVNLQSGKSADRLAFSPQGDTVLVAIGPDIRLYDTSTLKPVRSWPGHSQGVGAVAFSDDGRSLQTRSFYQNYDIRGDLMIWDTATWTPTKTSLQAQLNRPNLGVLSPDHAIFVGRAPPDRLKIFDATSGAQHAQLSIPPAKRPPNLGFFSPDGKFYIASVLDDANKELALVYSVPSLKLLCQLPIGQTDKPARPAAATLLSRSAGTPFVLSADGRFAAMVARGDGRIVVFDTAAELVKYRLGKEAPKELLQQSGEFMGAQLAISPNGKWLAYWTAWDNRVHIADLTNGTQSRSYPGDELIGDDVRFAFSADGRILAIATNQRIQLLETASMRLRKEFTGHLAHINALAFSPDGRYLATGSADTTVLIWDIRAR